MGNAKTFLEELGALCVVMDTYVERFESADGFDEHRTHAGELLRFLDELERKLDELLVGASTYVEGMKERVRELRSVLERECTEISSE